MDQLQLRLSLPGSAVCEFVPALECGFALPAAKWILDAVGAGLHVLAGGHSGDGLQRIRPGQRSPANFYRRFAVLSAHRSVHGVIGFDAARAKNARDAALWLD